MLETTTLILFVLFLNFIDIKCFNFDSKNVDVFARSDEYFGYSVMLQKGNPSAVLVGAPKTNSSSPNSGTVINCNLKTKVCNDYDLHKKDLFLIENGQMLGASLEGSAASGGSFVACAPRAIRYERKNGQTFYFSNGACYKIQNSSDFSSPFEVFTPLSVPSKQVTTYNSIPQYYYGFGELGASMHYNQDNKEYIFGSPGVMTWIGSVLRYRESSFNTPVISYKIPRRYQNFEWTIPNPVYSSVLKRETGTLFGYSVSSGKFRKNSNETWYVAGAPRAEKLNGIVLLFTLEDTSESSLLEQEVFIGKQISSYFGSAVLAVDVTNDGVADLFIGAPLYSSYTWDEGRVYFYKNKGNVKGTFENPIEINGSFRNGSRFGTTLADIGDIDRDGYKDVAISAPYENDGIGAIYIYLGGQNFKPKYSQKISPEMFSVKFPVKGFGFSISKGVDVDDNFYNDIAVGAYKSNQVFIIKSCGVVQMEPKLTSDISEIIFNTSSLTVKACIGFRTLSKQITKIDTNIQLSVDDERIFGNNFFKQNVSIKNNEMYCKETVIALKTSSSDYTKPLVINFLYEKITNFEKEFQTDCSVVNPEDETSISIIIPFAHGCGSDQICQTDLAVNAYIENLEHIIIGMTETITIHIDLFNNANEPAYLCYLYLLLPEGVEMEQLNSRCVIQNKMLKCLAENRLGHHQKKSLSLDIDVRNIDIDTKTLLFKIEANSTGEEIDYNDNLHKFVIPVDVEVSPHITGKSTPEQITYVNDDGEIVKESLSFVQEFQIVNSGPSPMDISVIFMLPTNINNQDFAKIYKPTAHINNELILQCATNDAFTTIDLQTQMPVTEASDLTIKTPANRTEHLNCLAENVGCVKISCFGGRLYKNSHTATVSLNLQINTTILTHLLQQELLSKDIIVYTSTAKVFVNNDFIDGQVHTIFYGKLQKEKIKTWVIVMSALAGIFFLSLAIFVLYKFDFFKRSLREKLINETSEDIGLESVTNSDYNNS